MLQEQKKLLYKAVGALELAENAIDVQEKEFYLIAYSEIIVELIKKPMERALGLLPGNESNARPICAASDNLNEVIKTANAHVNPVFANLLNDHAAQLETIPS